MAGSARIRELSSLSPYLELARACVDTRGELRRASQTLHDRVGSTLAAAGLQLQLLRMDAPAFADRFDEVLETLNGVMEDLRGLSRDLDPTPTGRAGLKNALLDLTDADLVQVRYAATAQIPPPAADAVYLATVATVAAAARRKAKKVVVSVAGSKSLTLKIHHDGSAADARRDLAATALLAEAAGLSFAIETKKSTIVLIRYAVRRSTGR